MSGTWMRRFRMMPRAARWCVVFGAFLAGYFLIVEPVIGLTLRINERADVAARRIEQHAALVREAADQRRGIALGVRRFGVVAPVGEPGVRPGEFNARIAEILRTCGVDAYTTRAGVAPMRGGRDSAAIDVRTAEVAFTAVPDVVMRVLAELERSPVVAGVQSVDLRLADDRATRTLAATFTLEMWMKGQTQ